MFTGVTEEDAGTGGEPCQELQHCDDEGLTLWGEKLLKQFSDMTHAHM